MARKSRKNLPQPEQAAASVLLPELEEAKIPAAIYGRLSVEDEEKEESMETQIALVQDYINRSSELSYVDTYFDNGFTGTNFKRPAFTRLMNDVRQKKIKCIVVKDLSRFGRNYLEAGYYIETVFPFLGIRLIAVTDDFDSTRTEDIADHQMNMFEDFIGYQGSAVLDEPVREEDSFSKESMSQESEISENILLPDLAKQSESIEQQSGEIAERGMPT